MLGIISSHGCIAALDSTGPTLEVTQDIQTGCDCNVNQELVLHEVATQNLKSQVKCAAGKNLCEDFGFMPTFGNGSIQSEATVPSTVDKLVLDCEPTMLDTPTAEEFFLGSVEGNEIPSAKPCPSLPSSQVTLQGNKSELQKEIGPTVSPTCEWSLPCREDIEPPFHLPDSVLQEGPECRCSGPP